ncbi:phosphatidylinositol 4-kinase [Theileria orientalis]|uniref:1-phosphatidylinositol 4-kinase n=1 Tax=Theileria orientalis TaxID=68886 RepID=A0A976QTE2_THEOR|nr:phosphatidylinositol 4-kinase [Theileria orientalis]
MTHEDTRNSNLVEDEHHNSSSSSNRADTEQYDWNDLLNNPEESPEQDLKYRNENNNESASTNTGTHENDMDADDKSKKAVEESGFTESKGPVQAEEESNKQVESPIVKRMEEVDESLLNDMKKTLDKTTNPLNSLFMDMADLKDARSKNMSHRTESVKSHHSAKSHESSERSKKKSSRKLEKHGTSENPLDITEMAVDCGSLLELYQNDYFDAFMHMYHLYHKKEPGVHEYLVNMLYTKRTDEEIGFYLPQLCQLSISKYGKSSLHRFLLDKASVSMHFALQLSWFYQAAIDDQIPKYDSLTQKMTQDTEMAVVNSKLISPNSFSRASQDMPNSKEMSFPCLLDRRLLLESFSKRRKTGDGNLHELCTNVDSLLSPQMPTSLVHNTFTLSTPCSKVKLLGVHTKLGNPLDLETHPILDYTDDLHLELQKLMMKQRRLNYFNMLNNFVVLCMENSSLLTTETKRECREPLLKVFVSALNEWMLLRRSTVAAYEESFAYTGLSLPFQYLNEPEMGYNAAKHKGSSNLDQAFSQIIRIVESETKIFFSKKRAPFVFYVEMANLDEDIEFISQNEKGSKNVSMKNLYVFDAIVEDLLRYDLIRETQVETIKNPLECIRYALDMLPEESLERYKNMLDNAKSSSEDEESFATPNESLSVSRSNSNSSSDTANWEERTELKEDPGTEVNGGDVGSQESGFSGLSEGMTPLTSDLDRPKVEVLGGLNGRVEESTPELTTEAAAQESGVEVVSETTGLKVESTDEQVGSPGVMDADSPKLRAVNRNLETEELKRNESGDSIYPDSDSDEDESAKLDLEMDKLTQETAKMNVDSPKSNVEKPTIVNGDSAKTNGETPKINGDGVNTGVNSDNGESPKLNGEGKAAEREVSESGRDSPRERDLKAPNIKSMTPEEVRSVLSKETFENKKDRIRRASPYGGLKSWDLYAFVVKGNDDLRQEKMANQILESFRRIFTKAKLPLWLRPIEILVTGSNSGIMEFLHDTYSVDVIKKKFNSESLAPVFEKLFHANIFEARKNFIESHAAYSIVAYLLQVKDRHNGNILLDPHGHVIHIDYGFCLSNFPGKLISFETTPFKLTKEYLDVIGGANSDNFLYFKTLVIKGLLEARKHVDEIVLLVEMMTTANKMPCFMAGTTATIEMFKERFMLTQSEETCIRKITEMVDASVNSFSTIQYDNFQRITNGIM